MPDYRDKYFARKDLYYDQEQFLWLLKSLKDIREGNYPPDLAGLTVPPIQKMGVKDEATFVKVVLVAAEVEVRIAKCRLDGLLLKALEAWGESAEWLARCFKMGEVEVSHRASRALKYCASGPAQRWQTTHRKDEEGKVIVKRWGRTYQEWINHTLIEDLVAYKRRNKREG